MLGGETVSVWTQYKDLAKERGVPYSVFYSRINNHWDPKEAASTPVGLQKQKDWAEWKHVAKENGIENRRFRDRRNAGWTSEDAATIQPANTRNTLQGNTSCAVYQNHECVFEGDKAGCERYLRQKIKFVDDECRINRNTIVFVVELF